MTRAAATQTTPPRQLPAPASRCTATLDGFRCAREAGHPGLHDCGWSFRDEEIVEEALRDARSVASR